MPGGSDHGATAAGATAASGVTAPVDTGYTESGVPTLEGVRERIEARYGTALGATELAANTPQAKTAEEAYEERHRAAEEKLQEIRESMRKPQD